MTPMRILCFILISSSGLLTAYSTWRYHKMLSYNRKESYTARGSSHLLETLLQIVMVFFIFGYIVGATDMVLRDVDPIFIFVAIVFFVGGLYIFAMVKVQISLEDSLRDKTMEVMLAFANSIEMKDAYTQGHSWHVYHIVRVFYANLPAAVRININEPKLLDAALLHDIGKMGVSNDTLNKKSRLSDADWQEIRLHPSIGKKMLANTCFAEIGDWVCYHHERIDGKGYHGLSGSDIPIESRIISIADTYSAITTDREYRPRRSYKEALDILKQAAGTQFDADLVECFNSINEQELVNLVDLVWKSKEKKTNDEVAA